MPKVESLEGVDAKMDNLSSTEWSELQQSFERSLEDTWSDDTSTLVEKIREYAGGLDGSQLGEVDVTAQIARHELNGSFDGQSPGSGNFGIDLIHPGYFGYDDWDDAPSFTGGSTNDWIDGNTPTNLSGSASNPITIGDTVVHIILGVGSFNADPVVTRVQWRKNDQPYPAVNTEQAFRNTDMRIKWLDTPLILQPTDDFEADVYCGGEVGQTYEDSVYLFGLSFLEAKKYRILDPADMAGTNDDDIVIQN